MIGVPLRRATGLPAARSERLMSIAVLISTTGNGLYATGGVLFFTRVVGLSPVRVGLGLSIAGLLGLAAGIPLGRLVDNSGPREIYAGILAAEGLAVAGFAMVRTFGSFLLVACLVGLADQGSRAVRGALIASIGGTGSIKFRAYLRSVTNVGMSLGMAAAGFAIHADTRTAYLCLIIADAASFGIAAAVISLLPRLTTQHSETARPGWISLRDRPYIAVTALSGVMSLQYEILIVGLPLWISDHTSSPRWIVSPLLILNTVLVVLFQVRASRGVNSVESGATITMRAGVVFTVSCATFAATTATRGWLTPLILVLAVTVHTIGEMWQAAGQFELSFTLAPSHAMGQYQGMFNLGTGGCIAVAPLILTTLCIAWGWPGWLVLAPVFLFGGVLTIPAARWAERTRNTAL
jgi:hypothetical protein